MRKTIILLASIVAVAFSLPAAAQNVKLHDQVLSVTAQLNENCSASLIYSDRDKTTGDVKSVLLTAGHCVEGAIGKDMVVDFPVYQGNRIVKKERYIGRAVGKYYKADLALIELKDKQTYFSKVAKLAPEKPVIDMGDEVYTVGYPLGMGLTITSGMFGAIETNDYAKDGQEYYRATPAIAGGNSGGALYQVSASGDYLLLGVTTAVARGNPHIGYYTPITDIREYLRYALAASVPVVKSAR